MAVPGSGFFRFGDPTSQAVLHRGAAGEAGDSGPALGTSTPELVVPVRASAARSRACVLALRSLCG
jgi:hypothetical protein